MDLHTLNSISDYAYASSSFAPSPPNAFTSQDEEASGVAPQALFYGLSGGELSDGLPSGRVSRGSGSRSPAAAPYAAVPRSQRFNPIAVPASRPSTRAQVAASHRRTKSARSNDIDSDDDDDEEFKPTTGSPAEAGDNIPRDSYVLTAFDQTKENLIFALVLRAAKLSASSASSPSNAVATS